jgi:tetratricopeptide (TPR) repeat protein
VIKTTDVCKTISRIRQLLKEGQTEEALLFLDRTGSENDMIHNARGVCLMRLGRNEEALKLLQKLAFNGLPAIASERPAIIQANYATALLLSGDNGQAWDIIRRLDEGEHPYVTALKQVVQGAKRRLRLKDRLMWTLTVYPSRRLDLDFVPGGL